MEDRPKVRKLVYETVQELNKIDDHETIWVSQDFHDRGISQKTFESLHCGLFLRDGTNIDCFLVSLNKRYEKWTIIDCQGKKRIIDGALVN